MPKQRLPKRYFAGFFAYACTRAGGRGGGRRAPHMGPYCVSGEGTYLSGSRSRDLMRCRQPPINGPAESRFSRAISQQRCVLEKYREHVIYRESCERDQSAERGMALETSHGVCCTQWLRCLQVNEHGPWNELKNGDSHATQYRTVY